MAWCPVQLVALGLTWLVFVTTLALNGLAGPGKPPFKNGIGNISNHFKIQVTPAGWTFSIWGVIYAWQFAWLLYASIGLCRRQLKTPVAPAPLLALYSAANLANIAWLFAWDRAILWLSPIIIALIPTLLWVCSGLAYRHFGSVRASLGRFDWWAYQLLFTNGLGWYATWTSLATCLNVGISLAYDAGVSQDVVAIVVIILWTLILVVYSSVDAYFCVKKDYTDLALAPFIVFFVGLIGSFSQNGNFDRPSSVLTFVLLVLASIALVIKLIAAVWFVAKRHRKVVLPM